MTFTSPYVNTISVLKEPPYPGDCRVESRLEDLVRWNALVAVMRANAERPGIGGHISTFASASTLYEVAFNHFLRGSRLADGPDIVYFQPHASPGIYARAFLEGRITEQMLG